jgi:WS/DGAT/MGAT family acyltransferase
MADELSPADRSSLAAEQGPVNMAVGGVLLFEGGPGLAHDAVIERLESRLHLIPRYRQRLQQPTPGGLTNPVWVDDSGFDAHWHVRRAATEDLAKLVGVEMSRRLDRSRPLWEMSLVSGADDGRVALVPKMHHALVDGVAAVDVGTVVLDPSPEPMDLSPDEPWSPQPFDRRKHLARLAAAPMFRAQRLFLQGAERAFATDPLQATRDLPRATELLAELARNRPQAPMTFLNRGIGPNRRFAMARASLAELKAAAKAAG